MIIILPMEQIIISRRSGDQDGSSWITADRLPVWLLDTGYCLSIFKHTWAACATENKSLRGHNMGQRLADSL